MAIAAGMGMVGNIVASLFEKECFVHRWGPEPSLLQCIFSLKDLFCTALSPQSHPVTEIGRPVVTQMSCHHQSQWA